MPAAEIKIRLMNKEDIKHVLVVERASFSSPWTEQAFKNELEQNQFASYMVAECQQKVVAYAGAWVIVDEAHITNIAVHPLYRRQKVGERLLRCLMLWARLKGALRMTLEVRVSNLVAQNLYRKLGFESKGVRPGYYTDNHEDALIMWADLEPCLASEWLETTEWEKQGDENGIGPE